MFLRLQIYEKNFEKIKFNNTNVHLYKRNYYFCTVFYN
jgi:hypothetical protein